MTCKNISILCSVPCIVEITQRAIMLFHMTLPTRCPKASFRAFISWITGMALSIRMLCAYSIGAPILKPEMWADTHWKTLLLFLLQT